MPKPAASDLPATVTSGQLAKLLGLTERSIAARRLDGRLSVAGKGIDLAALCRAGMSAGRGRMTWERINREAFSFAAFVAGKTAAAALAPHPGETPGQAAARAMDAAMTEDDTFSPPEGWEATEELDWRDYAEPLAEP